MDGQTWRNSCSVAFVILSSTLGKYASRTRYDSYQRKNIPILILKCRGDTQGLTTGRTLSKTEHIEMRGTPGWDSLLIDSQLQAASTLLHFRLQLFARQSLKHY